MTLGELQVQDRTRWRVTSYKHRSTAGKGSTEAMGMFVEDCIKDRLCEVVRMANEQGLSLDHLAADLDKEMRG